MTVQIPQLPVLFEDDALLVVNKPSGMLSQPGKTVDGSALTRVLQHIQAIEGPVLVHRLDMDTSGLLLMAKTRSVHRALQQQFEKRQVTKRYQGRLEKPTGALGGALGGAIRLPLRVDIDDRPRQIVCHEHGKPCYTLWHRSRNDDPHAITFYPLTGRTHQLRVHAASSSGLGNALAGDRLYGSSTTSGRLMLHADYLRFIHPLTQEYISLVCPSPF